MDGGNRINEISKRLSEPSLCISRIPLDTKRDFKAFANAKHSGDYGEALKEAYDQFIEYQYMKSLFFDKMQSMQDKIDLLFNFFQNKQEQKPAKPKRLGNRTEDERGVKK